MVREKVPEVPLIVPEVPDVEIAASEIESVSWITDLDVEELGVLGGACAADGVKEAPLIIISKGASSKLGMVPGDAMVAGVPAVPGIDEAEHRLMLDARVLQASSERGGIAQRRLRRPR